MRKPSIELLSEVLGEDVIIFEHPQFPHGNGVRYRFNVNSGRMGWINVYELMHLMKVWAVTKGYAIESEAPWNEEYRKGWIRHGIATLRTFTVIVEIFNANTEHEAVTKACEWILEHKKELKDENGSKDNS